MGLARPCLDPGCPNIVTQGSRCPDCYRKGRVRDVERRGSAAERGYDAAWVGVRDEYAREHPLCEDCLECGVVTAVQVVDHKIPLPEGPRLDKANLRSLCRSHHAVKTARDQRSGAVANVAPASREERQRWVVA